MAKAIATDEYGTWLSPLFPSGGYLGVVLVSACVGVGLFCVGFGISVIGGFEYLSAPGAYLGAFAVFCMLTALGVADSVYVDVWTDVRHAFDVDDETYWSVVRHRLDRIHDVRRVLAYAVVLAVPYFYVVAVSYIPGAPFRDVAVDLFFGGSLTYSPGVPTVVLFYLFGSVNALLIGTILNGFVNHLALVREVSELPFRNVYTTASDLEPVAGFTIASATAWFAGVSLIVLWIRAGISGTLGTTIIAVLVLAGIVFFLAPQVLLHDALSDAKRDELVDIRAEYREIHEMTQDTGPSASLRLRLEVTDRRLENAKAISTWVYDLTSMSKLAAAAVIPWLTLFQDLLSTVL